MKILICCENFYPSIGGVQEVCLQLAKRFTKEKHDVTVATSWNISRKIDQIHNINIKEFKIYGNFVKGIFGNQNSYLKFIHYNKFDIIFIYAAQQWTLDALLESLAIIKCKKYLVPCGFSMLYDKNYSTYFQILKNKLRFFDGIIFHTSAYRDYNFVKNSGIEESKLHLIPNGADENEFIDSIDKIAAKKKLNLKDNIILMTNGSLTNKKGLEEVLHAFSNVKVNQNISLFINTDFQNNITYKFFMFIKNLMIIILGKGDTLNYLRNLTNLANKINKQKNKFVKIVNYNRAELISLYQASDIFLFASKIEYSPLVIFEAMASQNAIISHDVGNVKEILEETKSGVLVKCEKNEESLSIINTHDFTQKIEFLINNPEIIKKLSNQGRLHFSKKYNWRTIFKSYKDILLKN